MKPVRKLEMYDWFPVHRKRLTTPNPIDVLKAQSEKSLEMNRESGAPLIPVPLPDDVLVPDELWERLKQAVETLSNVQVEVSEYLGYRGKV
jgi:hypothetical protein